MSFRPFRALLFACLGSLAVASCAQEEYPAGLWAEQHPAPSDASGGGVPDSGPQGPIACRQARATPIPARLVAISAAAAAASSATDGEVTEEQIFNEFKANCGSCHNGGQGNFTTPLETMFAAVAQSEDILDHVTGAVCPQAEDPTNLKDPMPPCNGNEGTYASRLPTDPIVQFGEDLKAWAKAGYVPQFSRSGNSGDAGGDAGHAPLSPYTMAPAVGDALTEIGNCIPARLAAVEDPKSAALDKMFATLASNPKAGTGAGQVGLPLHLSETDLFTLDSAVLAQFGVVAYAPGYPLWSDNAFKLRHVRVPYGTSIHFDKATQEFEIPPNTRFYKTFTKQIIETDGSYRYRKIETRLIVARPDENNSDGSAKAQTALFGSYQWNDSETDAVLVTTPLASEEPFADTVFSYNTDEPLAAAIQAAPLKPGFTLEQALLNPQPPFPPTPAARNYAIPSSQRCIQCHMGSPSESFNLGFTPLQINRRPTGTGGVIEEAGPDELTQLQRFIDYGLITGIDSPSDVLPLEKSEGSRTPRNNYELVAQGYAMGNCQHCHNPRGLPSVQNPKLASIFDFLPGPTGGIFQFPLESYSPAIFRGLSGSTPIPFITPSLVDLPRVVTSAAFGQIGTPQSDIFVTTGGTPGEPPDTVIYAPWRSLVYRNVDAAFTYTDDLAIFPHMPFNTPGYDPRAKQILGDWMVSIPAVRKHPELVEYAYTAYAQSLPNNEYSSLDNIGSPILDTTPQPYAEIPPGAPGYAEALAAAQQRLEVFHTGINPALPVATVTGTSDAGTSDATTSGATSAATVAYPYYSRYLDPGETNDILDPEVTENPICTPVPPTVTKGANPRTPYPLPNHPHWVTTDTTLPPPPWQPKNPGWPLALVEQQPVQPPAANCPNVASSTTAALSDESDAVGLLQTTHLSDLVGPDGTPDGVGYATTPLPFGLWQKFDSSVGPQKPCTFPTTGPKAVPLAKSFTGASRPHWMNLVNPPPDAPVYEETPGAAVFKMICINCHGPLADGNGPLAANLNIVTGGAAQVANFRAGLFGPQASPEADINSIFGTSAMNSIYMSKGFPPALLSTAEADWTGTASAPTTADDRAARYMPWMALGGTTVNIPEGILQLVAVTKVLGEQRVLSSGSLSGNMLSAAKELCYGLLGPVLTNGNFVYASWDAMYSYLDQPGLPPVNTSLLKDNGDAELWMRLCAIANPPPIHILRAPHLENGGPLGVSNETGTSPGLFTFSISNDTAGPGALLDSSLWTSLGGSSLGNASPGNPTPSVADSSLVLPTATTVGNLWPWCIDTLLDAAGTPITGTPTAQALTSYIDANNLQALVCPNEVMCTVDACALSGKVDPRPLPSIAPFCTQFGAGAGACFDDTRANQWAVRGAINAGMSVFTYVQSVEKAGGPPPDFDQCSQLK